MVIVPVCVPRIVGSVLATIVKAVAPGTATVAGLNGHVAPGKVDEAVQANVTVPVNPWIELAITPTEAGLVKLEVTVRRLGSTTKSGCAGCQIGRAHV